MRYFITILVFCSFILDFSSSREKRGMWSPLIEKMGMLDGRFSEYIDEDLPSDNLVKHNSSPITKNNRRIIDTSPTGSQTRVLKSSRIVSFVPSTKNSKYFSSSGMEAEPDSTNYKQDYPLQLNDEISEEGTLISTSNMASDKDFVNSVPYKSTPSIISHSPELSITNESSLLIDETSNSSSPVHLHSSPNSKLSKTAVAAIVAAINGVIGFTGAAIFTCTKHNYLVGAERQPLIN